jgi:hypothetical protein
MSHMRRRDGEASTRHQPHHQLGTVAGSPGGGTETTPVIVDRHDYRRPPTPDGPGRTAREAPATGGVARPRGEVAAQVVDVRRPVEHQQRPDQRLDVGLHRQEDGVQR